MADRLINNGIITIAYSGQWAIRRDAASNVYFGVQLNTDQQTPERTLYNDALSDVHHAQRQEA